MKAIITFVFALVYISNTQAQNYLYEPGDSGLHGSAFLSTSNFEDKAVLMPGYTIHARLTLGVDLGKGRDKVNKISSTIVRPNIHYLVLKQNEELPISIDVEAAYQINILPTTTFNSKALQIGGNLFHELELESKLKFIPFAGMLLNRTSIKNGTINGTIESEDIYPIYNLGLTLVINTTTLTSKYIRTNSINAIGLSVGVLL